MYKMKCILIQRKLHFICPCADNNIASLIADYADSSVASLRLPPVPRNLAIPITVRQLQRHLELDERGLSLPSLPRVVWPLFSAELFAPELGPMVGSLPSVIPICVFPYLSVDNHASLQQAHPRFHPLWGDTRLFLPGPGCYRRRRFGFGKVSPLLSTRHAQTSPYFIAHLIWDWLPASDRCVLADALPPMRPYAHLRVAAACLDLSLLHAPCPTLDSLPISKARAYCMAVALLRFNFEYGDFICWLGGEYTGARWDWNATFDIVNSV